MTIKQALISVSDKTGVLEFAQGLTAQGVNRKVGLIKQFVAWAAERKDVLNGLFVLASLLAAIVYLGYIL